MAEPYAYELTVDQGRGDWYALYTRHQHEKTVAHFLLARALETFLPLYDVVHQWKDRTKHLSQPFILATCSLVAD